MNSLTISINSGEVIIKLEQLERMHSEIPLPPHDYPDQWFTSDPMSKQEKSQSYKFEKIVKN